MDNYALAATKLNLIIMIIIVDMLLAYESFMTGERGFQKYTNFHELVIVSRCVYMPQLEGTNTSIG